MCSLHSALRLDLRKNKLEDLKKIVNEVLQVIERDEEMPSNRKSHMPNLTDLIVRGKPPSVFLTRFNPVVPLLKKAPRTQPFSHNTQYLTPDSRSTFRFFMRIIRLPKKVSLFENYGHHSIPISSVLKMMENGSFLKIFEEF